MVWSLIVYIEFLDEVATDILYMHSEKLDYYKGNFTQFHATKEERVRNQIREYEAQMEYRKHLQDFIDRWRYNAKRAPQAQSRIKILEKLPVLEPPTSEKEVTFSFPDPDAISPPVLQMNDCLFGYDPKKKVIIKDINLDVRLDSRIAVVGPNGAGKSTLLKLLIGQLTPNTGEVHRNGRLRIAYFTQHHIDQLDLTKSAVGFMADQYPGKSEEEYRRHLGAFGITGMVGLQVMKTLSGGQKSRVAFACLSLQRPHILVLDEVSYLQPSVCINELTLSSLSLSLPTIWIWNRLTRCRVHWNVSLVVSLPFLTTNALSTAYAMRFGSVRMVYSRSLLAPLRITR